MMPVKYNIEDWKNIMEYNSYLELKPFTQEKEEKKKILSERIRELVRLHMDKCPEYKKMMNAAGITEKDADEGTDMELSYEDVPFLPVRLFKELDLKSISSDDVVKTMTSSGTTGQAVSKIYLDKATSSNQQKVMVKIVSDFIGASRMPMLLIDCPSVVKDRRMFSARGAGVLGFSIFGRDKAYALRDEDMSLNIDEVAGFLKKHKGEKICYLALPLLFGSIFTENW